MVGRGAQLAVALAAVGAGRDRRAGSTLLLTGDAGMGKTTLATETLRIAGASGATVLVGRAAEGGGAFRPLVEALLPAADPSLAASPGLERYRPVLARLLPAWTGDRVETTTPLVDPLVVLGEALVELLTIVAGDSVCVLLLEDLHWADGDTAALLHYLAGRLSGAPVVVMGTARTDEAAGPGLQALLTHPLVTRVRLDRLSADDVATLAGARADRPLPADVVSHIVSLADGVPLLAEELAASLVDGTAPPGDAGVTAATSAPTRVPKTFAALVERRLTRLAPVGRRVVDMASVVGSSFDADVVATACGLDVGDVAGGLRAAVDAGLLVRDADGELRWRHALTRDAVLASLLPLERQSLARRAGEALVADDELHGERLLLAADLLEAGGRAADAARLLRSAGAEAVTTGALTTADDVLRRAGDLAGPRPVLAAQIAAERVGVLALAGRTDEAVAVAEHHLPRLSGDVRDALSLALVRALVAVGRFADAAAYLPTTPASTDPRAGALAAHVALGTGDTTRATELARDAVELGRRSGAFDAVCEALEVVGRACRRSDPLACEEAFAEAERTAALHGLTPWRIRALLELGTIDLLRGRGTARLLEVRALAHEAGMVATTAVLDLQIGAAIATQDGHVAAKPWVERAAAASQQLGMRGLRGMSVTLCAASLAASGRAEQIGPLVDEALAHVDASVDAASARCVQGLAIWFERLDEAAALPLLEQGLKPLQASATSGPTPWWGVWALLRTIVTDDHAALDELSSAGVLVQAGNEASLAYGEAILAARRGDGEAASGHVTTADAALTGMPFWRHFLHCVVARPLAAADAGIDVGAWLREALAFFDARQEVQLARTARALLRELGLPVPRQRHGADTVPERLRALGVTGREYEVLLLLGERLSNGDVADRLFLSARTVETHVSNLLAKTGSASRSDLVALLG